MVPARRGPARPGGPIVIVFENLRHRASAWRSRSRAIWSASARGHRGTPRRPGSSAVALRIFSLIAVKASVW